MVMSDCIHHGICMWLNGRSFHLLNSITDHCNSQCNFYVSGGYKIKMLDVEIMTLVDLISKAAHEQETGRKLSDPPAEESNNDERNSVPFDVKPF